MSLTLILGGVRAGKSARALRLASEMAEGRNVLFVATAQPFDDEMRARIAAHQSERPGGWHTLESPLDLPEDVGARLAASSADYGAVIVDCLTVWVGNVLLALPEDADAEAEVAERTRRLLDVLSRQRSVLVSNEVGLGVVPPTSLGRRYRDALGRANQLVAAAAEKVLLLVAGIEVPLKT